MINLYCVGIYFNKSLAFKDDGGGLMLGSSLLVEAAKHGLRYQVNSSGHNEYLSYTPKTGDNLRHAPLNGIFPFYGLPLPLSESLRQVGEISHIFQYTTSGTVKTPVDTNVPPQFSNNAFSDGSDLRIRLISIFANQAQPFSGSAQV
jgi:hypothetical protein